MDLTSVFTQIRDKLDAHYDRRERLVKISRDITALSKKMIFSLQRIQGEVTILPEGIQKDLDQREMEIHKLLKRAEPDIQGPNAYRYQRQISPGIQEYIEALTFRHYILHKTIPSSTELQKSYFTILPLSYEDYILGIADLTGELMRRAINNVSITKGRSLAIDICNTLHQLLSSFQRIYIAPSNAMRGFAWDLSSKIEVMKSSVSKVEDACYKMVLRGSEKPDGWSIDFKDERVKRVDRDGSDEDEVGRGKRQRISAD